MVLLILPALVVCFVFVFLFAFFFCLSLAWHTCTPLLQANAQSLLSPCLVPVLLQSSLRKSFFFLLEMGWHYDRERQEAGKKWEH